MRFVAAFGPGAVGQGRAVQPLGQGAGSAEPEVGSRNLKERCKEGVEHEWTVTGLLRYPQLLKV